MAARQAWIYKWNATGRFHKSKGRDWATVFESGDVCTGYGFDNPVGRRLIGEVSLKDLLIAYQTDQRTAIGICEVTGIDLENGEPRIRFVALRRFPSPAKLHDLKHTDAALKKVEALRQGPVQSLYRLTADEAKTVLRACGLTDAEARSLLP